MELGASEIEEGEATGALTAEPYVVKTEEQLADEREAEIKRTVTKLRKKREISRQNQ